MPVDEASDRAHRVLRAGRPPIANHRRRSPGQRAASSSVAHPRATTPTTRPVVVAQRGRAHRRLHECAHPRVCARARSTASRIVPPDGEAVVAKARESPCSAANEPWNVVPSGERVRAFPSGAPKVARSSTSSASISCRIRDACGLRYSEQGLSRGNDARSSSNTSQPARARKNAVVEPAGPPPTTITSASRRHHSTREVLLTAEDQHVALDQTRPSSCPGVGCRKSMTTVPVDRRKASRRQSRCLSPTRHRPIDTTVSVTLRCVDDGWIAHHRTRTSRSSR